MRVPVVELLWWNGIGVMCTPLVVGAHPFPQAAVGVRFTEPVCGLRVGWVLRWFACAHPLSWERTPSRGLQWVCA
ncbi:MULTISPECIES: hypothetical protein [Nocardiaceae]|uniref:Secreted protein n=1 Tax=Rhodococcoides corynebacterioides TaxID=53972 RepID=A0ABS2KNZ3_9NOCA|nr:MULTISPECIES: hypothetical protein [Rhodococcus]MBM7413674.1 hypothetical protein [Rhodococcus corynebacterioides]MBP1116137.1 hypothetical protein [Rhodococcus sp. PvP016]